MPHDKFSVIRNFGYYYFLHKTIPMIFDNCALFAVFNNSRVFFERQLLHIGITPDFFETEVV
jgi:hypothetical protein